jgi:hypothetical protein
MVPEVGPSEWGVWISRIADEAPSGMGIECEKERDEKMVGIPKSLEGLLADLGMSGRVHEKHT